MMTLEANERQTGVYGTVNKGDTITVSDELGKELIEIGNFKKAKVANETATPEQVVAHNESGLPQNPIHADGTNREILNDEGREIHNSGPEAMTESAARAEAEIAPDVAVPSSDETVVKETTKSTKKTA